MSKDGHVKFKTEAAPVSGYYMIPIYDKGEFKLVVEEPNGWSFEPKEVSIDIDGKTDKCSVQEDINFIFKGFSIAGQALIHFYLPVTKITSKCMCILVLFT